MFSKYLKTLSILKKFLFINFVIFTIIGLFTFIYLNNIQPSLIKKKSQNHTNIINNTIDNILRLDVKFQSDDIRRFLFSTRFIFQNLDRVIFFDDQLNLIGDTDTLDLDPRSFSTRLDKIEFESLDNEEIEKTIEEKNIKIDEKKPVSFKDILKNYSSSENLGAPYTFTQEDFNQFNVTTIKNVTKNEINLGYVAITENANEIKTAIDERKAFVIRTAISVGFVILIFSFVLSRYFIKPIQNLVGYTIRVKEKSQVKPGIENLKKRKMLKDEVALSKEKMKKIDIEPIIQSVVDDYNNIHQVKKGIKIEYKNDGKDKYLINGIENRIEQIIANLLDNSISFSKDGANVFVDVSVNGKNQISIKIIDEGQGFKEKDTSRIFKRFYSNRPEKFGEHSGLGLNIVKNLVELHDGEIVASNRIDKEGAMIEIRFPNV